MASNRSTRAGSTIKLRTLFQDDLGDFAQATDVYIHVFKPDIDTTDLSLAYLVSGVPTYLGQGIFEYEFSVPPCGPDGLWQDRWVGELACQSIDGVMGFDVTTSGIAQQVDSQLSQNDIVQVTVASGLAATDGSYLGTEFNLEFLTTTSPSFTNPRKVRLDVGSFVKDIPDFVLELAILEASLEADALNFAESVTNNKLFQHARREYTTCLASKTLLNNTGSLLLRSKTLADLSVTYDTNGVRDALARIEDCLAKWMPQVISGGGTKAAQSPKYVVKGEWDPDRAIASRMWESTTEGGISRRVPAANDRLGNTRKRRFKRTWISPRTSKKWW